uniref:Uncharacterized protein n=1 Tax=Solanum lycopersicum TaxID=4081 RepID=A0A3Q7EIG9_SOLLC
MNKIGPSSSKSQSPKIIHQNHNYNNPPKISLQNPLFLIFSRKSKVVSFLKKKKINLFGFKWRCCTCSLQWRFLQCL